MWLFNFLIGLTIYCILIYLTVLYFDYSVKLNTTYSTFKTMPNLINTRDTWVFNNCYWLIVPKWITDGYNRLNYLVNYNIIRYSIV